jgi:hypothetical protein
MVDLHRGPDALRLWSLEFGLESGFACLDRIIKVFSIVPCLTPERFPLPIFHHLLLIV